MVTANLVILFEINKWGYFEDVVDGKSKLPDAKSG
jgi:hypothetical protein